MEGPFKFHVVGEIRNISLSDWQYCVNIIQHQYSLSVSNTKKVPLLVLHTKKTGIGASIILYVERRVSVEKKIIATLSAI